MDTSGGAGKLWYEVENVLLCIERKGCKQARKYAFLCRKEGDIP